MIVVFAVMTPMQRDGGAELIDPEFRAWFLDEPAAREWARNWAVTHSGRAIVYRCVPLVDIQREQTVQIKEVEYPA